MSVSGVRGRVGEALTPEIVTRFAAGFGAWAISGGETLDVVVGRDSRVSGPMFHRAVIASSYERINRERDDPIGQALYIFFCVHADGDQARAMVIERLSKQYAQDFSKLAGKYALAGTPDEVLARLREYVAAGAQSVIVSSACRSAYRDENERLFAAEVLPALRGATAS